MVAFVEGSVPDDASRDTISVARIEVRTKSEAAYAELRRRILDGSLAPGTVLNQEGLAPALGVSVTPLREALRRLEGEGLVEFRSDKMASVIPLTRCELNELREVRLCLEPLAAGLAAIRATPEERSLFTSLAQLPPTNDMLVWHAAHGSFHRAIHEAARNTVLTESLVRLWERLTRYRLVALNDGDYGQTWSGAGHSHLADVISAGNIEDAERLMFDHLQVALGGELASLEGRFGHSSGLVDSGSQ